MTDQRAEFGEFDSILATEKNAYLIESKWDGNGKNKQRVNLKPTQRKRHKILQWYFDNWKESVNWSDFIKKKESEFTQNFPENKIAPTNTILMNSLIEVLTIIQKKNLYHVLMYFHCKTPSEPRIDYPKLTFKKVMIPYSNEQNLIELEP